MVQLFVFMGLGDLWVSQLEAFSSGDQSMDLDRDRSPGHMQVWRAEVA
jgi:hypothetical protein